MKRFVLIAATFFALTGTVNAAELTPRTAPVVPKQFSAQFFADVTRAAQAGREVAWAKVGDSNSAKRANFYSLGCSKVDLGRYPNLAGALKRYLRTDLPGKSPCAEHNSFTRISAAARGGSPSSLYTKKVRPEITGWFWRDPLCSTRETYLSCEIRLSNPRYTIISTGTNDFGFGLSLKTATARYVRLVQATRALRSTPVLTTIPPITRLKYFSSVADSVRQVWQLNSAILAAGRITGAPVINHWRSLYVLPRSGILEDGLHLNAPDGDPLLTSSDFSRLGVLYGANRRNLNTLQALWNMDLAYVNR